MENPPLPKVRGPSCKLTAKAQEALEKLAKKKGSDRWTKETLHKKWRKFNLAWSCNISKKSFECKIQRLASAGNKPHFRWTSDHQKWINKHHKEKCHEKLWQEFQTVFPGPKQPSKRAFQNRMLYSSKQRMERLNQKAAKAAAGKTEDSLLLLAHAAAADDGGGCDGGGCSSGRQRTFTNGSYVTTHMYHRSTRDPTPPPPPPPPPNVDTAPKAGDGSPAVSPVSPADDPLFSGSSDGVRWEDIRGSPQVSPGGSAAGWQAVSPVGSSSSAWLVHVAESPVALSPVALSPVALSPDGGPADSANVAAGPAAGLPLLP
jgi:hypothetical protein